MRCGTTQLPGTHVKSSRPEISNFFSKKTSTQHTQYRNCSEYFWLAGHWVSVTTTQLCHCSMKIAIDNMNEHV